MITLAVIFTLIANVLTAGNDYLNTTPPASSYVSVSSLAPVAPMVATFEDANINPDIAGLYPVVPAEATFEDTNANPLLLRSLAPEIPAEADFE